MPTKEIYQDVVELIAQLLDILKMEKKLELDYHLVPERLFPDIPEL